MFFHYLKIGIRQVNKYKIHHAISALCLAVGMVVFALTIQFIQARWEDHDKAYVELCDKNGNYTTCDDVQQITALQDIIGTDHPLLVQTMRGDAATPQVTVTDLEGNSMPYKATCTEANEAVMESYRHTLTRGSRLPAQANEIIVSQRFARKIARGKSPVGYTLTPHPLVYLSFKSTEDASLRIVGVASIPSDFQMLFKREDISYATPGISITFTDRKQIREWNENLKNVKLSIRGVLCHPTLTPYESGNRSAELLLLFFSSLILISGIVHFLKFTFQIFYQRSRELILRRTMGEKAKGTFQLLNTEILMILTCSLFLAFLLSQYAIEITEQYIFPEQLHWLIPSEIRLTLIGIYAGMLLLCMLFTFIPIYKLRKSNFIVELNRYGRHHKYRNFMIGLQMSIALLFLGLTLAVVSFADEVANIYYKTGVDDTRIFEIESDNFLFAQNREAIFSEIRQMPEIESALPYISYLDGRQVSKFEMNSGLQKKELDLNVIYSTSDYFEFFEYPEMSHVKDNKYPQAYVNRKLYQVLQQTPTPHLLKVNDKSYAVAGICDYFYNEWKERQQYMALIDVASAVVTRPKDFSWVFKMNEKVSVEKTKDKIESICRKFVPETLPLHIHPLNEQPEYKMFQQILQAVGLLTFFSILLMLLSIYSSVMLDVQTRQKEMALRKINGARKTDIFRIFIRDYCLCYLAAFAVVFLLTKALIAMVIPERTEVINWVWAVKLFFSVGILIAVVLFKQVRHLMKLNPAEVTKYD